MFGDYFGALWFGVWFGELATPETGSWTHGVSHYRNTSGVSRIAHTEAGDPISSVSMDKTDGVSERWWTE
jgi:hypothetical protein